MIFLGDVVQTSLGFFTLRALGMLSVSDAVVDAVWLDSFTFGDFPVELEDDDLPLPFGLSQCLSSV